MTTEEAIKNRILYHCDERQHFYKLGKGVIDYCVKDIISDLSALREKAEREKGCEYCTDPATINQTGRKFFKSLPMGSISSQGEICLAYDKDGWNVHFEDCDDTGVMCNAPINKCPMCGRRLEVQDER